MYGGWNCIRSRCSLAFRTRDGGRRRLGVRASFFRLHRVFVSARLRVTGWIKARVRSGRIIHLEHVANIKNHVSAFAVTATYFRLPKAIAGGGYEDGMPTQRADIDNVAIGVDLRLQPDLAGDMRDPGHLWVDGLNKPRPFNIRFLADESGAENYGHSYCFQYRLARTHGQGTVPQSGFCALLAYPQLVQQQKESNCV